MDWPSDDTEWTAQDYKVFDYEERDTTTLTKQKSTEISSRVVIRDKPQWDRWFGDASSKLDKHNSLHIMLFSRAVPVFEGEEDAPVSYLPVTKSTWERLTKEFHVPRSITRTLSRRVASVSLSFGDHDITKEPKISYVARTSATLQGDLGLSVTYTPRNGNIYGIVYGCDPLQAEEFERRIWLASNKTQHPLLAMGILAEIERERLVNLVDDLVDKFALRSEHVESKYIKLSSDMSSAKTQEYLHLCLQSRGLADQIRAVKRQILTFIGDIHDLEEYLILHREEISPIEGTLSERQLKRTGRLMKKRLQDIINEYDDKIDECNMIVGNTSLAMQTVWNLIAKHDSQTNTSIARANTAIALDTKRESSQMRSIAILTMIYLPLSSVAAIFSMGMFNWMPGEGESIVSKYIWIFVVLAAGLTTLTLLAWRHVTNRHEKKEDAKERSQTINSLKLPEGLV
ncbi:hypothetical protein F5Y15DRAFT_34877 [Xylariaceae sp. FL0016]|nr:hypothetical protein F5Y15DRAFT_34877 [Xylariaceae sp. FL0016]